jgi:hypothetical protein
VAEKQGINGGYFETIWCHYEKGSEVNVSRSHDSVSSVINSGNKTEEEIQYTPDYLYE